MHVCAHAHIHTHTLEPKLREKNNNTQNGKPNMLCSYKSVSVCEIYTADQQFNIILRALYNRGNNRGKKDRQRRTERLFMLNKSSFSL